VLGRHRDDLAATQTDLHQVHQIGPHPVELCLTDCPAGPVGINAVAEQQLAAVDVANAGDDALVHQQRPDGSARLRDSAPRPRRVGVAPQWVGAQPGQDVTHLGFVDDLAHRGAAQVGAVVGANHPHPHLADRFGQRLATRGNAPFPEGTVETEVHVHDRPASSRLVVVEQVLAPGVGAQQNPPVHSRTGESVLRAGHRDRCPGESALMQPGQPVQGMPFRHASTRSARHRRCLVSTFVFGEDVDTPLVAFGFRP